MKKRIPTFFAGMLTTAIIFVFSVSALAATGQLTITVDPVNIQVNGATFAPKDAQGVSVPVFAYNGTTYAPLRALAEAYGLEVGYDETAKMATVKGDVTSPTTTPTPDKPIPADYSDWTEEEEKAYQEFKGMWEVALASDFTGGTVLINAINSDTALQWWENATAETKQEFAIRQYEEIKASLSKNYPLAVIYRAEPAGNLLTVLPGGDVHIKA